MEKSIRSEAIVKTARKIEAVEDPEFETLSDQVRHALNFSEVTRERRRLFTI